MRVFVLGGDGFCGWPTVLHLSNSDHDVTIVDNFSRREIDRDLGMQSLTPIRSLGRRLNRWKQVSGRTVKAHNIDLAENYEDLLKVLEAERPDIDRTFCRVAGSALLHEVRAAQELYNAKQCVWHRACAERNCRNWHRGPSCASRDHGVYGYGGTDAALPDGYMPVYVCCESGDLKRQEIVHPSDPGSVYHLTKVMDHHAFRYYAKNDGILITGLHPGIVWGTQTPETELHEDLINRYDYDGDYGTVLNRFLLQLTIRYPLTAHGTGGQTRAFIHIRDTVKCIELALLNPPEAGERVQIANQMAETRRVNELAQMVAEHTGSEIAYVDNPRNEAARNDLNVKNNVLCGFGWKPITLADGLLEEVEQAARRYRHRCDCSKIPATSIWTARQVPGIPMLVRLAAE